MNKIKKGLGRGLSSLIGETKVETKTNKLSLSEITPNKFQPRKNFDEESLDDFDRINTSFLDPHFDLFDRSCLFENPIIGSKIF